MGQRGVIFILSALIIPFVSFSQKSKKKVKIRLTVVVRNQETNELIPEASVKIVGTDNSSEEFLTNKNGIVQTNHLRLGYEYTFECSKDKCLGNNGRVSTNNLSEPKDFIVDVFLICGGHPILFPDFDFEKNSIVLDSLHSDSLTWMYHTLVENPTIIVSTEVKYFKGQNKKMAQERANSIKKALIQKGIVEERLLFSFRKVYRQKKEEECTVENIQIISWDFIPKDEK